MKTLSEIQKQLRDIMPEGIDLTFQAIKNVLLEGTDQYKDLILLESRYKEAIRQMALGVIAYDTIQLELNKIRLDISNFIDCLQESHLKREEGAAVQDSRPDIYNGEVMYRIPKKMTQHEEVKCIVRLAFDRKVLMEDLEEEEGDVLKDIRIAEVMGVELIDSGDEAFKIRTINDTVQFVEKDLYTEWIFYVKPLLPGMHPLILKISVIEILNGVERKRNVVLEEKVEIVTTQPVAEEADSFSSAGYVMQMAAGQGTAAAEAAVTAKDARPANPVPGAPAQPAPARNAPPPPPPSPAPAAPRSGNFKKMTSALAGLVVLLVASYALWHSIGPGNNNNITQVDPADKKEWENLKGNSSREELEAFVNANPDSEFKDDAQNKLDSMETAAWHAALASNTDVAIREYMSNYPKGRYYEDAVAVLQFNEDPAAGGQAEPPIVAPEPEPVPVKPGRTNTKPGKKPDKKTGSSGKVDPGKETTTQKPAEEPKATEPVKEDPNKPLTKLYASRMPVHSGCEQEDKRKEEACTEGKIRKHILRYLKYPEEARRQGITGTIVVEFVVERDGNITEVKAKNDLGGGTAEEAVRIVNKLTRFKPGLDREGKPARILYIVPIKFELGNK